ncbi:MAG: hypothetical protein ABQ298_04885 [Puniceicoccaceae bacterium]
MRFSILKAILSWQAWKRPPYRRSIQSRANRRRKPRPLLPKRSARRVKRTRKLMRRQRYKRPEQTKLQVRQVALHFLFSVIVAWVCYEGVMSSLLLE